MGKALYYCCPALQVVEYRAHSGAYVEGVPQPTAVMGFARAACLALERKGLLRLEQPLGMAYAVSDWNTPIGIARRTVTEHGKNSKAKDAAPFDPRSRTTATLSLILELVQPDDGPFLSAAELEAQLLRMSLLSGSIFLMREGAQTISVRHAKCFDSLRDAVRFAPANAFFVTDARQDLEAILEGHPSTWAALTALLARPVTGYKPHYAGALVGWSPLTALDTPSALRPVAVGHRWVEPVIGAVQFRNRGSMTQMVSRGDAGAPELWRYAPVEADAPEYLVVGSPCFEEPDEFVF